MHTLVQNMRTRCTFCKQRRTVLVETPTDWGVLAFCVQVRPWNGRSTHTYTRSYTPTQVHGRAQTVHTHTTAEGTNRFEVDPALSFLCTLVNTKDVGRVLVQPFMHTLVRNMRTRSTLAQPRRTVYVETPD